MQIAVSDAAAAYSIEPACPDAPAWAAELLQKPNYPNDPGDLGHAAHCIWY